MKDDPKQSAEFDYKRACNRRGYLSAIPQICPVHEEEQISATLFFLDRKIAVEPVKSRGSRGAFKVDRTTLYRYRVLAQ